MTKTKCERCGREYDIPDKIPVINCACGAQVKKEKIKPKEKKRKKKGKKK